MKEKAEQKSLSSSLEALLFVSAKSMEIKELAEILKNDVDVVKETALLLNKEYEENKRGLRLIHNKNKLQMVSAPQEAKFVSELAKSEVSGELSRPSLEALTVIAYRGPITKDDLDKIRGINCAQILRNLLVRGLIEGENKKNGEPSYSISLDFLRFLGLQDVKDLPDYVKLNQNENIDKILTQNEVSDLQG